VRIVKFCCLSLSGFYAREEYKTENVNFTLGHIYPSFLVESVWGNYSYGVFLSDAITHVRVVYLVQ
jgi:hypothetical protein